MGKKKMELEDLGGLVFSTDPELIPEQDDHEESWLPEDQSLRVYLDKKQRRGKVVTIIEGFEGTEEDLKSLAKVLKSHCGAGGSAKDGLIIVQGSFVDKISNRLRSDGYHVGK